MVWLNAPARPVRYVTVNRKDHTRPVNLLSDLRSGDSNYSSIPALAGNNRYVGIDLLNRFISELGDGQIEDLLLDRFTLLVSRVQMFGQPASLNMIASIKELDYGTRCVHPPGRIYARPKPEPQVVCCHALAISATSYLDQGTEPGIRSFGQVFQTQRHNRPVFTNQFSHVSNGTNRHNLQKRLDLRFPAAFAKQGMDEVESDSHTSEVLIGVITSSLVRIENCECRRGALGFIREMVIGNDYVQDVVTSPIGRFLRSNSAIDAYYKLIAVV